MVEPISPDAAIELADDGEVLGQIGGQDIVDEQLPEGDVVLLRQVLQDVVLLLLDYLESQGTVIVLQDGLIVVDHGLVRTYGHHEGIIEPWMTNVVNGGRDDQSDTVDLIINPAYSGEQSFEPTVEEEGTGVGDINCMDGVVIVVVVVVRLDAVEEVDHDAFRQVSKRFEGSRRLEERYLNFL